MPPRRLPRRRPQDQRKLFLHDLRGLRAQRGLSLEELAARTGFTTQQHAAVETGPGLPSLPALEAYLRGCGEPLARWEDRWRRLTLGGPGAGDLPVRDPGATPLAAAGAALAAVPSAAAPGESAVPPQPAPASNRPGAPGLRRRRALSRRLVFTALAAAVALVAVGGIAIRSLSGRGDHGAVAPNAAPRGGWPAGSAGPPLRSGHPAPGRGPGGRLDVAGVGCPRDNRGTVVLVDAPSGPGWIAAGGGWTGNGCDGTAVWTFNPNGNQPIPSAVTWTFVPAPGATRCTLEVFVPAQNALGVSEYEIFSVTPDAAQMIASVRVWQGATAGRWVTLGSYRVAGTFEIRAMPGMSPLAGPGPGAHGRDHVAQAPGYNAAIAASAASAACS